MTVLFITILYVFSTFILALTYGSSDIQLCFWLWFTLFCPIVNTVILLSILIRKIRVITVKTSFKEFIKQLKEI